jgi:hypothetical protein
VSHPRWGALLAATTAISAAANIALMATAVGRLALVDQWERTAVAFGREIDDAGFARLLQLSDQGAIGYALAAALVSGPLLTLGVAAVLKVLANDRATLRQAMTVATHAGVILMLRSVIAAPISYVRESTSSATSLASWFSMLDKASPVARFLGAIDLFVIWWAIVLGIGAAVLYRRRARTLAATFVSIYAALALLLAIAMAVTAGA